MLWKLITSGFISKYAFDFLVNSALISYLFISSQSFQNLIFVKNVQKSKRLLKYNDQKTIFIACCFAGGFLFGLMQESFRDVLCGSSV